MLYGRWLREATSTLAAAGIPSARLDAELLLAYALGQDRVYLHAHATDKLSDSEKQRADQYLKRRSARTPLAYITGVKEFYGRTFKVTPSVLIPRPETETLIELIEDLELPPDAYIADIGTGSGAIAITLKLNAPSRHLFATDISAEALAIAQENARTLNADVVWLQGDLLGPLRNPVDLIVANLPYVDRTWERSPETAFEPSLALFADDGGVELIEQLIAGTAPFLNESGYLALEADPVQHARIVTIAQTKSLRHIRTEGYGVILGR